MKKLYKFYWECGRSGDVEGVFISTDEEIEKSIGKEVYFGEILGKYSEVSGVLSHEDIDTLNVSESTVKELEEVLGKTISGYNPLDYITLTCSECGDSAVKDDVFWYINEKDDILCYECFSELEDKSKIREL